MPHRIDRILCPYANTPVVGIERRTDFDISIQHRIKALQDNRRFLSGKLARRLEGAVLITGNNTECRDLTYYVFIAVGERLCQFRQIDVWVYRLNGLPSQLAEFIAVDIQAVWCMIGQSESVFLRLFDYIFSPSAGNIAVIRLFALISVAVQQILGRTVTAEPAVIFV